MDQQRGKRYSSVDQYHKQGQQEKKEKSPNESQSPSHSRELTYLYSIVCTPEALARPYESNQNPSQDLFAAYSLDKINKKKGHLCIQSILAEETEKPEPGLDFQPDEIPDHMLQNQFEKCYASMKRNMPKFIEKLYSTDYPTKSQSRFDQFVSQKVKEAEKGGPKRFVIYYSPISKFGPIVKSVVLSDGLLELLGYEPDKFLLENQQTGISSLCLLSQTAYVSVFLNYIMSLRKYITKELFDDMTHEEVIEESEQQIFNQMRGIKKVKVQMKCTMPECDIFYEEVTKVYSMKPNDFMEAQKILEREHYEQFLRNPCKSPHKKQDQDEKRVKKVHFPHRNIANSFFSKNIASNVSRSLDKLCDRKKR